MNYTERALIAANQLFRHEWRGTVMDINIQHDSWCPTLKGSPKCKCTPTIIFHTPTGDFEVDEKGRPFLRC